VILTGTGEEFTGPICSEEERPLDHRPTPQQWDHFYWTGKHLQMNLLNIEVPMIAAVNGPAYRHMELALLCDVVLASDTAVFVDSGHFDAGNLVPGDGVNVACMLAMGVNRARYFHLTGQQLSAVEARDFGVVNEVLPQADVLPRAWELAERMARKTDLQLRYSRVILTQHIKKQMQDLVGYGMALEGLCISDPSSPFGA
jgi:enoyl-CoA hydratase/carnithine racemase